MTKIINVDISWLILGVVAITLVLSGKMTIGCHYFTTPAGTMTYCGFSNLQLDKLPPASREEKSNDAR